MWLHIFELSVESTLRWDACTPTMALKTLSWVHTLPWGARVKFNSYIFHCYLAPEQSRNILRAMCDLRSEVGHVARSGGGRRRVAHPLRQTTACLLLTTWIVSIKMSPWGGRHGRVSVDTCVSSPASTTQAWAKNNLLLLLLLSPSPPGTCVSKPDAQLYWKHSFMVIIGSQRILVYNNHLV